MIKIPPYLKKGDTIGIVCPAGYMPVEKAQTCINTLQQWGYNIKVGKTLGNQFHYFSGTDAERLEDMQQMMDDNNVHAILCGRGGYGISRIIDNLDFTAFKKKPKWVIGYSDITLLHAHLQQKLKIASLHAPMAAAFNDDGAGNDFVQSLRKSITGKKAKYDVRTHPLNREGIAEGILTGGNLSLLVHSLGTVSEINTAKKLLFIEDVGEYIYNVDRMMMQLERAGKLADIAGLIVGSFSDMKDTTIPFGQQVYELIKEKTAAYNYPVCFGFPVGHSTENYTLKCGATFKLTIGHKQVILAEL